MPRLFALLATVFLSAGSALHAAALPPLLAPGDEPVVATRHSIRTAHGTLEYEARAGRLPIRNDESGEVRGHIFFMAYMVESDRPRPLTFAWNGGPTAPSVLLHTEVLGPKRLAGAALVDNAETLLSASDLVFVDPIGTGFSRAGKPDYDTEFLSTLGDFAATAEFIRAYRVRFGVEEQPLYLLGESYGTWRVGGATELLVKRGIDVAGMLLISGGIPGSQMPFEFSDAFAIPARTATAFEHKRLPADLMRNRDRTMKAVERWVEESYLPALRKLDSLSDQQRTQIAAQLARFTGMPVESIDKTRLVMTNREYLKTFPGDGKVLDTFDMRILANRSADAERAQVITSYIRNELGYRTDLAYTPLEDGYMPMPGPARRSTGSRWSYDHTEITPEVLERAKAGGGPPASQPWLQNAMRIDHDLRTFVAAGRYDSLNMCEGNLRMVARLENELARRFTNRCYEGGHMMYRDSATRLQLSRDLAEFVTARR